MFILDQTVLSQSENLLSTLGEVQNELTNINIKSHCIIPCVSCKIAVLTIQVLMN